MDLNRKLVAKNAFRVTKVRNYTAVRIRVPGGHLEAEHVKTLAALAEEFGNGTVHFTARQGVEIPGIRFEDMARVNERLVGLIEMIGLEVAAEDRLKGYPAAGTRNISACIGSRVCPFANDDTTKLAKRIEREVFPHDFHFKIGVTGCPNDCIKAHMQDFGVICITEPQYDEDRCISCNACVKVCKKKVTGALREEGFRIIRDEDLCIGCGECVLACPTQAMSRSKKKYYRMVIMGRTGKKNPRLAEIFMDWADEEAIVQVIKNTYAFVDKHIDRSLPKEHIGYIVDRMGYPYFRDLVLEGVSLDKKTLVARHMTWSGYPYKRGINMGRYEKKS